VTIDSNRFLYISAHSFILPELYKGAPSLIASLIFWTIPVDF